MLAATNERYMSLPDTDGLICNWHIQKMKTRNRLAIANRSLRVSCAHNIYVEGIYSNSVTLKSGLEVTQDHWKWYHSIDRIYEYLLAFHSNYNGAILYRLRDIASYLSKSRHLYLALPQGGGWPRRNFAKMFDTHKTIRLVVKKLYVYTATRCGDEETVR